MNREHKVRRILDLINSNPGMFQYVVSDGDTGCCRCAACDSDDYAEDGPIFLRWLSQSDQPLRGV